MHQADEDPDEMAMKRSDLLELLGAAAVVLGLVFVGLELQQNTALQRIETTQALVQEYGDALEVMAYEGDAACIYVLGINGLDNLDDVERLRFFVILFQIYRAAEQLQYYAEEGMVEPRIWRGFERQITEVISLPGVKEWWALRRSWFSDSFQAYLDQRIEVGPTVTPQMYPDQSCRDGLGTAANPG